MYIIRLTDLTKGSADVEQLNQFILDLNAELSKPKGGSVRKLLEEIESLKKRVYDLEHP